VIEAAVTPQTASHEPAGLQEIELNVNRSLETLAAVTERLAELAVEARGMDALAAALPARRAELEGQRNQLELAAAANRAETTRLRELEAALKTEQAALQMRDELLARREAVLEERRQELAERERTFEQRAARLHWRWLVRAWQWRPPAPSRKPRSCELLFVPSPDGYKLIEQAGIALAPNARLGGLLDEHRTFTVTKIVQMPFDGRWCAYLQQVK
jgi:hypothetical protein